NLLPVRHSGGDAHADGLSTAGLKSCRISLYRGNKVECCRRGKVTAFRRPSGAAKTARRLTKTTAAEHTPENVFKAAALITGSLVPATKRATKDVLKATVLSTSGEPR